MRNVLGRRGPAIRAWRTGGILARMWLVLGNKTKAQSVPGGRTLDRHCPGCRTTRTFVECDVKDSVSAFFVTVFEATQRRLVCLDCGEDVGLEEAPAAPTTPRPATPAPARPTPSDAEKDAMLAALKKKMGL